MNSGVGDAYDAMVKPYVAIALDDLDRPHGDRDRLDAFAALVDRDAGAVADLGCGPGHITAHLSAMGLDVVGYDLSPGMVDEADSSAST